jgi:hypothetical protein
MEIWDTAIKKEGDDLRESINYEAPRYETACSYVWNTRIASETFRKEKRLMIT